MSLFRRKRDAGGADEQRALPGALVTLPASTPMPTWAGETVTTDAALRLSAVFACVRLLADTVSTLPLDVYRPGSREPVEPPSVLVEPAAGQPLHDWLYQVMVSLVLRGNAYAVVTDRAGIGLRPSQLELVHPDRVGVSVQNDGTVDYRIGGRTYAREDVLHLRAFPVPGAVCGLSVVEYARQSIGVGLAATRYGAAYFADASTPSGLLTTDMVLNEEQAQRLKDRWKSKMGDKRRETAVLDAGAKFQPISLRPDESQFIETSAANVVDVCRYFGVPPELVGASAQGARSLTYASRLDLAHDFLRFGISPWLVRLQSAIENNLLPRGWHCRFNTGGMLRADTRTRYETYEVAIRSGVMTVNEARELEDLPPLEGVQAQPDDDDGAEGVVVA